MSWICPGCERDLRAPNQWHHCAKVSIDSLFAGKKEELIFIFDKLLGEIIDWEKVTVSATKNCVVFLHSQTFLVKRPMKSQLDLKFYSETALEEPPVIKTVFYSGKYENHIRETALDELTPEIFAYIKIISPPIVDSYKSMKSLSCKGVLISICNLGR